MRTTLYRLLTGVSALISLPFLTVHPGCSEEPKEPIHWRGHDTDYRNPRENNAPAASPQEHQPKANP